MESTPMRVWRALDRRRELGLLEPSETVHSFCDLWAFALEVGFFALVPINRDVIGRFAKESSQGSLGRQQHEISILYNQFKAHRSFPLVCMVGAGNVDLISGNAADFEILESVITNLKTAIDSFC